MIDWTPLWLSLRVASCATALSILIGFPLALLLARRRLFARPLWEGLVNVPLVLPPTVLGYALLVGLGRRSAAGQWYEHLVGHPLAFTWEGAAVAASIVSLPLFVAHARLALAAVDSDALDAARVDGAGGFALLRRIALPLASPGLLAGLSLAYARALGDFGATLMFAGDTPGVTQTLPLAVYDALQIDQTPTVRIFCLISVSLSLIVCCLAAALTPRRP